MLQGAGRGVVSSKWLEVPKPTIFVLLPFSTKFPLMWPKAKFWRWFLVFAYAYFLPLPNWLTHSSTESRNKNRNGSVRKSREVLRNEDLPGCWITYSSRQTIEGAVNISCLVLSLSSQHVWKVSRPVRDWTCAPTRAVIITHLPPVHRLFADGNNTAALSAAKLGTHVWQEW